MNKLAIFLLVLLISATYSVNGKKIVLLPCSLYDDVEDLDTFCPEELENKKVCGIDATEIQTYADACEACRTNGVYGFIQGKCTEEQEQQFADHEIGRCDPNNRPTGCTKEFQLPGYCGNLIAPPQDGFSYDNYGTLCQVCMDTNVDFYVKGECEDFIGGNQSSLLHLSYIALLVFLANLL